MGSIFPGPTPPYSNPPINPQNYKPSRFVISNIILGAKTIIQTTLPMNYVIGQLVRLLVPPSYGSYQLNEILGYVISIPTKNQVTLNIDSTQNVNNFISSSATTVPEIIAVGDVNTGYISSTGVNIPFVSIPGTFINIS